MKIGPVDIRIYALVYCVAILVILIVMLHMYSANSNVRLEGFYRTTVLTAMNTDGTNAQQEGIDACQTILKVSPQNANVRLYLGTLLLRQKKFADAEKEFKDAADVAGASPDEKAYALIGAGVAHFRAMTNDEPPKYAAAAAECEKLYFQKAVDSQKNNGDALANLAFCKALQSPGSAGSQMKACDAAMAGSPPPSLSGLQQIYTLKGLALLQDGKAFEALIEFERAQAMQPAGLPGLPVPVLNRRLALQGGMTQKEISQSQRQALIQTIEKEIGGYGNQEVAVWNSLGVARWLLKSDADYPKKIFPAARLNFQTAISRDPKDSRAYFNQAGIIEDRVADLSRSLSVPVPGLSGDPPPPNPWVETGKAEMTQADKATVSEISVLLHEEDSMWDYFFGKADVGAPDRAGAKLRQLACVRRLAFLSLDANKGPLLARALGIAEELTKIEPNNGETHFAYGEVLLEQGQGSQQTKAVNEFKAAKTCGMKSPLLDRLLAELENRSELSDVRPSKAGPSFGAAPLIRATLSGINADTVKGYAMTLDGREVQGARIGSQVLYLPKTDELKDGKHTIAVRINDGSGGPPVTLPEFTFHVNKKPPVWKITEEGGTPQPVWKINLTDEAGIDFGSLQITLKNAAGGFKRNLVTGGKVMLAMAKADVKANETIAKDEFKISSGTDLIAGSYTLSIDVTDNAGNVLRDVSRAFEVK